MHKSSFFVASDYNTTLNFDEDWVNEQGRDENKFNLYKEKTELVFKGIIGAIDAALRDHELVKVRLRQPEDKKAVAADLAARTQSALCGVVGHTVILYRPDPEAPQIDLPRRTG